MYDLRFIACISGGVSRKAVLGAFYVSGFHLFKSEWGMIMACSFGANEVIVVCNFWTLSSSINLVDQTHYFVARASEIM